MELEDFINLPSIPSTRSLTELLALVRSWERTYGATNIRRWQHGWLLLRMVLFAASRLKFV